jgi:hypothetical protein
VRPHRLILDDLRDVREDLPEHLVVGTGAYAGRDISPSQLTTLIRRRNESRRHHGKPARPNEAPDRQELSELGFDNPAQQRRGIHRDRAGGNHLLERDHPRAPA